MIRLILRGMIPSVIAIICFYAYVILSTGALESFLLEPFFSDPQWLKWGFLFVAGVSVVLSLCLSCPFISTLFKNGLRVQDKKPRSSTFGISYDEGRIRRILKAYPHLLKQGSGSTSLRGIAKVFNNQELMGYLCRFNERYFEKIFAEAQRGVVNWKQEHHQMCKLFKLIHYHYQLKSRLTIVLLLYIQSEVAYQERLDRLKRVGPFDYKKFLYCIISLSIYPDNKPVISDVLRLAEDLDVHVRHVPFFTSRILIQHLKAAIEVVKLKGLDHQLRQPEEDLSGVNPYSKMIATEGSSRFLLSNATEDDLNLGFQ
ncbi:hypothetical protein WDW89_26215 [Deltaproteobacteria bacterium TL4]